MKTANYGYSMGKHIAFAYLPIECSEPGMEVEVMYFGVMYTAVVTAEPLFDKEQTHSMCWVTFRCTCPRGGYQA
jgi:glycine cleavage system aminomethyltransferase T